MERKGWQKEPAEPEGIKMEPKESKMEPKDNKMKPKVTNMELQDAKRDPKGNQNASKSRLGRQGRFGEPKRVTAQDILGTILVLFLIKKL